MRIFFVIMQFCVCPCLAIFVTVFVFLFVIVVATLVSRSSQVIFVFVFIMFFFFLSSLYLSWPAGYNGLKIFTTPGDSYFAFKLEFIVQNPHCFYQNILLILWCWMNVFDDSIKSNGGFECLSPKLELKVNVETSKVFALNGIE